MYKKALAKNLKELRKALGYRQQDMADVLNLKRATYAKMETGITYGSTETYAKIFVLFGVTFEKLLGLEKNALRLNCNRKVAREFDKICRSEGISGEEAIGRFVDKVVMQRRIPSEISADEKRN